MIVSRPEFLRRFRDAFGDVELGDASYSYLLCFRTVLESGEYFYGAPFVIHNPLDLYYHINNVDGVVVDTLVDQQADIVFLGYWSDFSGLESCERNVRVCASFRGIYLTEEEVSQ